MRKIQHKHQNMFAIISQIDYKTRVYSYVINEQLYDEEIQILAQGLADWYENESIKEHKLDKNFIKSQELTTSLNNEIKHLLEKSATGYNEQNLNYFVEEFKKIEKLSEQIFASYNNIFGKQN